MASSSASGPHTYNTGVGRAEHSTINQYFGSNSARGRQGELLVPGSVPEAAFNSLNNQHVPRCMQGTREEVLKGIEDWAFTGGPEHIYWLKGMAGTGKSTIALTMAHRFDTQHHAHLGASFFFSRQGRTLSECRGLPATIAGQLARISEDLHEQIREALEMSPNISKLDFQTQWKTLVHEPVKRSRSSLPCPLLVVIDALDECGDHRDLEHLIHCLASCDSQLPLRFLITSRPEESLEQAMGKVPETSCKMSSLEVNSAIVHKDLTRYLEVTLKEIKDETGLVGHPSLPEIAQALVANASGLFIYAATACRFIRDGGSQLASERLKSLLEEDRSVLNEDETLALMYRNVLAGSFPANINSEERSKLQKKFCHIVGCLIGLFDIASTRDLASLLKLSPREISTTLRCFRSVLNVPEQDDQPISILHPSFRDFLSDTSKCEKEFYVDFREIHEQILESCLGSMSSGLHRNMLGLESPTARVGEVTRANVESKIPFDVRYASQYWCRHLRNAGISPHQHQGITDHLRLRNLFWLETLCWLGRLKDAAEAMRMLQRTVLSLANMSTQDAVDWKWRGISIFTRRRNKAEQLALDFSTTVGATEKLLLNAASIISVMPLQIYCCALIFDGNLDSSNAQQQNIHHLPAWISKIPDLGSTTSGPRHIQQEYPIRRLIFSPLEDILAVVSDDGTLSIWDSITGIALWRTSPPAYVIHDVAFSRTDSIVLTVSRQESIARLWDIRSGSQIRQISPFASFEQFWTYIIPAFSLSGHASIVAATAENLSIWSESTGSIQTIIVEKSVDAAISPDGATLAIVQASGQVQVWGLSFLHKCWSVQLGGSISATQTCVSFSYDSESIAIFAYGFPITIYDVATGIQTVLSDSGWYRTNKLEARVKQVNFCPHGRYLAVSWVNGMVGLWSLESGQAQWIRQAQRGNGAAIAFSPRGNAMAVTRVNNSITLTNSAKPSLFQEKFKVMLSMDRRTIIVEADDLRPRTLVMDNASGKERVINNLWSRSMRPVALSSNGQILITATESTLEGYCTLRIWDTYSFVQSKGKPQKANVTISWSYMVAAAVSNQGDVSVLGDGGMVQLLKVGQHYWKDFLDLRPEDRPSQSHSAMAFATDSQTLAVMWCRTIGLWNTQNGSKLLHIVEGITDYGNMPTLAFSPNGEAIASASRTKIRIWNTSSGRSEHSIAVKSPPRALSFSSDGKYITTEQGSYPIPGSQGPSSDDIMVSGNWVSEGGMDVIFVPPRVAKSFVCVSGRRAYFWDGWGKTTFLELSTSPKSMIKKD